MLKASSVAAMRASRSAAFTSSPFVKTDRVGDGGGVQRTHRSVIALLQAMPPVDKHEDAGERGTAAQIVARELAPGCGFRFRHRRVTVSRHVDETSLAAKIEEDELLRAARRARRARERRAAGQRVDERGLADVRAAGEGDLRRPDRRQAVGTRGGENEFAIAREQLAASLGPVRREGRFTHVGVLAGLLFFGNSRARLPQSSTFTPALLMM